MGEQQRFKVWLMRDDRGWTAEVLGEDGHTLYTSGFFKTKEAAKDAANKWLESQFPTTG